tara:strand:- start:1557 stop:1802 length:246 start_codon:yes stop_codon:yes gene_type:complete
MKEEDVCGETIQLHFDENITLLNLELVRVDGKNDVPYYQVHFEDWTKKDKSKTLIKLHIKDAIQLKSIIDNLVIDMIEDMR